MTALSGVIRDGLHGSLHELTETIHELTKALKDAPQHQAQGKSVSMIGLFSGKPPPTFPPLPMTFLREKPNRGRDGRGCPCNGVRDEIFDQ